MSENVSLTVDPQDLKTARKELTLAIKAVMPLTGIEIEDDKGFAIADNWLAKIRDARKKVKARMGKILDPLKESMNGLKEAMKEAKDLQDEMDIPLEERENMVRAAMKEYKRKELERAQQAEREQEEKEAEIQRQLEAKQKAEDAARTKVMREKLAAERLELEQKAAVASLPVYTPPVKVAHSTSRVERKCRVVDNVAFMQAYMAPGSKIPEDCITLNLPAINRYHKQAMSDVEKWPGIEGYNDVTIVGGR